jgi:hypothetical protein
MTQSDIWDEHGRINWDLVHPSQLDPQDLDYEIYRLRLERDIYREALQKIAGNRWARRRKMRKIAEAVLVEDLR